jgi:hypothetical protein
MGKGRKRKQGKRTKSGRLSRAGQVRFDQGSEHSQAMQSLYGQDGCDAIGRAFRTGLLGEGSDAKAMLDKARQVSNAYWHAFSTGSYTSAIADKTGGSTPSIPAEVALRREQWLNEVLDSLNSLGASERRHFDQLVIDVNPDCGPAWLDRLCSGSRQKPVRHNPADLTALRLALKGLAMVSGVDQPVIKLQKAA